MNWKHLIGGQTLFYNAQDPHVCRNNKKTIESTQSFTNGLGGGGEGGAKYTFDTSSKCQLSFLEQRPT